MKPPRWHVEHPYQEPGVYVADTATTALVAKVYPADGILAGELDTEGRARLLAAAPEMLAALSKLYEYRNRMLARSGAAGHRCTSTGEWVCDPWTQAFKDAGAALAKATGREA